MESHDVAALLVKKTNDGLMSRSNWCNSQDGLNSRIGGPVSIPNPGHPSTLTEHPVHRIEENEKSESLGDSLRKNRTAQTGVKNSKSWYEGSSLSNLGLERGNRVWYVKPTIQTTAQSTNVPCESKPKGTSKNSKIFHAPNDIKVPTLIFIKKKYPSLQDKSIPEQKVNYLNILFSSSKNEVELEPIKLLPQPSTCCRFNKLCAFTDSAIERYEGVEKFTPNMLTEKNKMYLEEQNIEVMVEPITGSLACGTWNNIATPTCVRGPIKRRENMMFEVDYIDAKTSPKFVSNILGEGSGQDSFYNKDICLIFGSYPSMNARTKFVPDEGINNPPGKMIRHHLSLQIEDEGIKLMDVPIFHSSSVHISMQDLEDMQAYLDTFISVGDQVNYLQDCEAFRNRRREAGLEISIIHDHWEDDKQRFVTSGDTSSVALLAEALDEMLPSL